MTFAVRARLAALALAAALATPAAAGAQEAEIGLPLGMAARPVVIEDLDGRPVDLARYVGRKPVLLLFWATWCPLCDALEPRLRAAHGRYGERVEFLYVAVGVNQNPRSIRRHLERHPASGRVLWDADGAAVRAFLAPSTSYVVALDAAGRVVYTGVGQDQDIEAAVRRAIGP